MLKYLPIFPSKLHNESDSLVNNNILSYSIMGTDIYLHYIFSIFPYLIRGKQELKLPTQLKVTVV